jgi:hypothetical protein
MLTRSPCCVSVYPLINFSILKPIFIKLGMYIMTPEPISTGNLIKPSHRSVCLYVHPSIVARQRVGKNVTKETNTHATMEEQLHASFSTRSVSYQGK